MEHINLLEENGNCQFVPAQGSDESAMESSLVTLLQKTGVRGQMHSVIWSHDAPALTRDVRYIFSVVKVIEEEGLPPLLCTHWVLLRGDFEIASFAHASQEEIRQFAVHMTPLPAAEFVRGVYKNGLQRLQGVLAEADSEMFQKVIDDIAVLSPNMPDGMTWVALDGVSMQMTPVQTFNRYGHPRLPAVGFTLPDKSFLLIDEAECRAQHGLPDLGDPDFGHRWYEGGRA